MCWKMRPKRWHFSISFVDKGLIESTCSMWSNSDFGHVTYTEAIEILEKHNDEFEYKVFLGMLICRRSMSVI